MRISCLCRSRFAPVSALTRSAWSGAGTTPHNGIVWMGRRSETHPGRGCGRGLLRPRSFEQSPGQITLPAHRPAQHEVATGQFVKENVLVERPGNEKEAPFVQTRVSETAAWPPDSDAGPATAAWPPDSDAGPATGTWPPPRR